MAISEAKKRIVIDNYFKKECDVNTSIKEAFIKGFELGLKKAPIPQQVRWISVRERLPEEGEEVLVSGYDTHNKKVIVARYQGEQYGFTCGLVSAWMPLPKPYESQESEE